MTLFYRLLASKLFSEISDKNESIKVHLKPSEMLCLINSYMSVLISVEGSVTIDMTKAFNNVLLQQKQMVDSQNAPTVTSHYIEL